MNWKAATEGDCSLAAGEHCGLATCLQSLPVAIRVENHRTVQSLYQCCVKQKGK